MRGIQSFFHAVVGLSAGLVSILLCSGSKKSIYSRERKCWLLEPSEYTQHLSSEIVILHTQSSTALHNNYNSNIKKH